VPGSDETFSSISHWVKECQESHSMNGSVSYNKSLIEQNEGGNIAYTRFRPTQLIAVNSKNGKISARLTVRELTTSDIPTTWCCPSYCWGGDQPVRTTKTTLEIYMDEIPFSELPKTLQDALIVTNGIGLENIWIVCLCIIQDDPENLASEFSQMSSIYKYSEITISASSADSCHSGFLQKSTAIFGARNHTCLELLLVFLISD